ncbi:MAG: GNAT family N-acetyltransferase [Chloroflexi bacterium]|nr:MAG: GNAT family N-acetyltransferase [Chloroflexota bacterium]
MLEKIEQELKIPAGFGIRPAKWSDLEASVSLFNLCDKAYSGSPSHTIEDLEIEWTSPNFDLEKSTRVIVAPNGDIVGYIEVWDLGSMPVSPSAWGRVHPDYENMGLGTVLLTWAEARARQVLERIPEEIRVVMRASTVSTNEGARQLFYDYGMTLVRHFWTMRIDFDGLPEQPVWPEGIRLTTFAERPNLSEVYHAFDEAFKDHWGHTPNAPEEAIARWQNWIERDPKYDPTLWFLALDGDEIAGVSLCRKVDPEIETHGHVNILGVRRPWRRQGLALALLRHSFVELYKRGKQGVTLGVDASSLTGATRLYKKAGMYVAKQFDTFEKELRPGRDIRTQSVTE